MSENLINAIAAKIGSNLRAHRSLLMQETRMHDAIAAALVSAGITFEREFELSKTERLDFFLPSEAIALEIKKRHASLADLPQIGRYLEHASVAGVIAIALRIDDLPSNFRGKPVGQIALWRYLL